MDTRDTGIMTRDSTTMNEVVDSPRNVMAVGALPCEFSSSTHAFPTAVFDTCGNDAHILTSAIAGTKARKTARMKSWRSHGFAFPFLDFSTDEGQVKPKLRPKKSCIEIGGSQTSLEVFRGSGAKGRRSVKNLLKPTKVSPVRVVKSGMEDNGKLAVHPRPKSAAIAIEKACNLGREEDNDQPSLSAEKMYDWATWRMYTRITDHRRRFPLRQPYTHGPRASCNDAMFQEEEEEMDGGKGETETDQPEYLLDGAIFELEL